MAQVSVAQAARLVGRDRRTLYRDYIKTGRLTATTGATGNKVVDTAELERVFGQLLSVAGDSFVCDKMRQAETSISTSALNSDLIRLKALETEVALLREILAAKDANLTDLRTEVSATKALESGFEAQWNRNYS